MSVWLFLLFGFGFGFICDLILKRWDAGFLEKLTIRFGMGLLTLPILGVVLATLHIPLQWWIFALLAFATAIAAIMLRKDTLMKDALGVSKEINTLKIKKSTVYQLLAIVLFISAAQMYIGGSFNYPWFEDGDPYGYAMVSEFIAEECTFFHDEYFAHYVYPYTQGYQIFMGMLLQVHDSTYWVMKFFMSLLCALSLLFFYSFVHAFTNKPDIAFWSTAVLWAVPAWLSHFIYSLNFNMVLIPVFLYALVRTEEDKRWQYLGGLALASLIVSHFYTSLILIILTVIYIGLRILVMAKIEKPLLNTLGLGLLASLVYWVPVFVTKSHLFEEGHELGGVYVFYPLIKHLLGIGGIVAAIFFAALIFLYIAKVNDNLRLRFLEKKYLAPVIVAGTTLAFLALLILPAEKIMYSGGSASRSYTWGDFFIASPTNMINNPVGIGLVAMTLCCIGLILLLLNYRKLFEEKNFFLLVSLMWLVFTFLGVKGYDLSIGFVPFRMWTFFAIPVALVAGYFIHELIKLSQVPKEMPLKVGAFIVLFALVGYGLYATSFSQKYYHNTVPWPEHQVMHPDSQPLYIWMRDNLPSGTFVLPYCIYPMTSFGYDMKVPMWKYPELGEHMGGSEEPYYNALIKGSAEDAYLFLKEREVEYTILGASCIAKAKRDPQLMNTVLQDLFNHTGFQLVHATNSEFLFRVV
ncbi:hypothetical protein H6504_03650 [Candidatus Woesearchaeota archaeon]|nr:hypothetical protein [Candidatus Woesearchaeota archaeon]